MDMKFISKQTDSTIDLLKPQTVVGPRINFQIKSHTRLYRCKIFADFDVDFGLLCNFHRNIFFFFMFFFLGGGVRLALLFHIKTHHHQIERARERDGNGVSIAVNECIYKSSGFGKQFV